MTGVCAIRWLRSSTYWLTGVVTRRLAIDEHMANLLAEPGSNPRPFLADLAVRNHRADDTPVLRGSVIKRTRARAQA